MLLSGRVMGTRGLVAGALVTALGVGLAPLALATTGGQAEPVRAHVWVTTPDGADRLSDLGTVAFSGSPATVPTSSRWA